MRKMGNAEIVMAGPGITKDQGVAADRVGRGLMLLPAMLREDFGKLKKNMKLGFFLPAPYPNSRRQWTPNGITARSFPTGEY
ncbi:hypothetical protein BCR34DRAFT_119229 [Clohesyomyces aquaticus]|uniref:Uncharacterized protein n=1 Tax=Clohesyomyces aquaticus TaxID=1231657 RepID=A0A1Y2A2L4_9PLEO|nr:hypothetical protein BCR34DRAFT_119229 [Clohesyomyces aquaticus]